MGGTQARCLRLQVYCRDCQRCICAICVLEEHRTHKTVSVQTERLAKQVRRRHSPAPSPLPANHGASSGQKLVARTEQEMVNRIKDRETRLSQLRKKMEAAKVRGRRPAPARVKGHRAQRLL